MMTIDDTGLSILEKSLRLHLRFELLRPCPPQNLVVAPLSRTHFTTGEAPPSSTIHFVVNVGSVVLLSICHGGDAVSVPLSLHPLSLVSPTIGPDIQAFPVHSTIAPHPLVSSSSIESHGP